MFKSKTYGDLELEQVPEKLLDYYNKMKEYDSPFEIVVGTDSQNFDATKIVSVIVMTCKGHGGIFFYDVTIQNKINDVRTKLFIETELSLKLATSLINILESEKYSDLYLNTNFAIHVDADASDNGKTKALIPELIGWIKASGFECEVKPDSYAASSVADKLSK